MGGLKFGVIAGIAVVAMNAPAICRAAPSDLSWSTSRPVKVIFDTDMYGDIDDALALAMLHALESRGEIELLAVTISTETKWAARYVDLINTFYGREEIPIGMVSGGVSAQALKKSKYGDYLPSPNGINYTQYLSSLTREGGVPVYPHDSLDITDCEDSVALLRRVLDDQPDRSVVIIGVGYLTNLARLLDSKSDRASSFDGRALIEQKVRFLSIMAGNFAGTELDGGKRSSGLPEFNLEMDVPAAQKVFQQWPTPIVVSGSEVGSRMLFPQSAIDRYFSYVDRHPVAETYKYAASFYRKFSKKPGSPHDHATFDLTSVLYAARPEGAYFTQSGAGTVAVLAGGRSEFVPDNEGNHWLLVLPDAQKARTLEAMTMLVSQPPAHCVFRKEQGAPTAVGTPCRVVE